MTMIIKLKYKTHHETVNGAVLLLFFFFFFFFFALYDRMRNIETFKMLRVRGGVVVKRWTTN